MKQGYGFAQLALLAFCVSGLTVVTAAPADAGAISRTYTFSDPTIEAIESYSRVHIDGLTELANPGEPLLPALGAHILLPPGEEVIRVEVIPGPREVLPGRYLIEPAQMEHPLSQPVPYARTEPNPAIYASGAVFPPQTGVHVTTERASGHDIAFVRLHPVEYLPAERTIAFYRSLEVRILTMPSATRLEEQAAMYRGDVRTARRIERLIDNPSAGARYSETLPEDLTGQRSSETYPYLIITDDPYISTLQDLADLKTARGLKARIVKVDSLTANMPGDDDAEKIRNYIIEAYQNYGTEYVLLAGDEEIIPSRKMYVTAFGSYEDTGMATDLYYGALDGDWNDDGDGRWGEPGEADLIPEVHVGRAPIDNTTEATNFVTKALKYQQDPVISECTLALFAGELLWDDPTWGGDYMEELRLGSTAHGYTTAGFPIHITGDTLYDRGVANPTWNKEDLIPLLNGGVNLVHHLGHCSNTYAMRMYDSDVDTRFTNDGETHSYFVIYTQGCYCNAFDNRTSSGGATSDAISEHFVTIEHGAAAFIGNTRYGFGAHLSTDGASQRFHRQFVDAMFTEGIYEIAATNDDSKIDNIPFIDMGGIRWCYYEICVMGDPEMHMWTNAPTTLSVTHDGNCWVGQNEYEVVVTSGRGPVENAVVCMRTDDDDVYTWGRTDESGSVFLDPSPSQTNTATLVAYAHDHFVAEDSVTIQISQDAYLVCSQSVVTDDGSGGSEGNGDGGMDAGETIELSIELENVGQTTIDDVFAVLTSQDLRTRVTSDSVYYGTIPGSGTAFGHAPYVVAVGDQCSDGYELELELIIETGRSHGVRHLSFTIGAPVLEMMSYDFSDLMSGDGDGCLRPSETVDLTVTITNTGSDKAHDILGRLIDSDPYVVLMADSSLVDSLGVGDQVDLTFQIQFDSNCPTPYSAEIPVELLAGAGQVSSDQCAARVPGSLYTDFENAQVGEWTHYFVSSGYVDEWHLHDQFSYGEGTYCWKCGAYDGNYADNSDGGLVTPEVCLAGSDTLEFWHRIRAEDDVNNTAWDGGILEMTLDGGETWQQITPIGGYPYTIIDNPASPFDPGTPCWSGLKIWEFAQFDVTAYTGPAQFRFRFGSDSYSTYGGWWIDNVILRTEAMTGAQDEIVLLPTGPAAFGLAQNRPNPFNPVTTVRFAVPRESAVSIAVYNVLGQEVRSLLDEVRPAGFHEVTWDGTDTNGRAVASGIYFCKMQAEDFSAVKRMILLK